MEGKEISPKVAAASVTNRLFILISYIYTFLPWLIPFALGKQFLYPFHSRFHCLLHNPACYLCLAVSFSPNVFLSPTKHHGWYLSWPNHSVTTIYQFVSSPFCLVFVPWTWNIIVPSWIFFLLASFITLPFTYPTQDKIYLK